VQIFQIIEGWAEKLKHDVLVLWFALKNPQTPLLTKVVGFFTVAYALSPIDLIPDFVPILGYLDDIILIPILVWITLKLIPESVISLSRQQAQEWLSINQSKPKSRFGLLLILTMWLLVFWLCIKHLF
jgi:uncharacterized membrane protein YkvA (DUF1232 family)